MGGAEISTKSTAASRCTFSVSKTNSLSRLDLGVLNVIFPLHYMPNSYDHAARAVDASGIVDQSVREHSFLGEPPLFL
jgi:hypothetical protein